MYVSFLDKPIDVHFTILNIEHAVSKETSSCAQLGLGKDTRCLRLAAWVDLAAQSQTLGEFSGLKPLKPKGNGWSDKGQIQTNDDSMMIQWFNDEWKPQLVLRCYLKDSVYGLQDATEHILFSETHGYLLKQGSESWALNLKEQKSVQYSNNIHSNPHPEGNGFWLSSYGWNAASSSNASCRLGIPGLFQGYLQKLEPWVV